MPPAALPTPADVVTRALYVYVERGIAGNVPAGGRAPDTTDVKARALYLYVGRSAAGHPAGGEPLDQDDVLARALYLYVERELGLTPADVDARTLYAYNDYTDGELFPWIERIVPDEALPGQQIAIYGDGFGATEAAEGGIVRLGSPPDPTQAGPGTALGIVSWSSRSPNLWPANSGQRSEPAIIATVPDPATSGMISVEETT